jgi:RimJ/RimL family protein N-acetyltransferase
MEFYPSTVTRAESDEFVDRIEVHFDETEFGLWAVEIVGSGEFAGYVGLWPATFESHFTPAIEVGWRLARRFWGSGLAPEAAQATIDDGFHRLGFDEIVSFTSAINLNSRRVMEKLGMKHDPTDDFDHPAVAVNDPLRPHVLYRLAAPQPAR